MAVPLSESLSPRFGKDIDSVRTQERRASACVTANVGAITNCLSRRAGPDPQASTASDWPVGFRRSGLDSYWVAPEACWVDSVRQGPFRQELADSGAIHLDFRACCGDQTAGLGHSASTVFHC